MTSLYVHVPFCLSTCSYCSFNSYAGMENIYSRYVKALKEEAVGLAFSRQTGPISTLFFGGGTPTVLSAEKLCLVIDFCREYFGLEDNIEISLEANPKTIDLMKLLSLKEAGVNRLSIGIQSFVDHELQLLGRLHGAQDGWNAAKDVLSAGFTNISLDLMSGIPGQSVESWKWSLEAALSLEPKHLSLYQLAVEEGTPFYRKMSEGKLELPREDEILAMDGVIDELCSASNMQQYEISNYAQPGYECKHNIRYWENEEYLSLGAGAVSYWQGERTKSIADPHEYCRRIENQENIIVEQEKLDHHGSFRETVVMGLRMNSGVSLKRLSERYNLTPQEYYGSQLDRLIKNGMLQLSESYLSLTKKGRVLANQVMAELV